MTDDHPTISIRFESAMPTDARQLAGHIRDARGKRVTQLDPVAVHLLRQYDIIDAESLRSIVAQEGVRIQRRERIALIGSLLGVLLVIVLLAYSVLVKGDFTSAPLARTASLISFCLFPTAFWIYLKRLRFVHVQAVMLRHLRCPHCGYDLRMLAADPTDGSTVCPECGCAWLLQQPAS